MKGICIDTERLSAPLIKEGNTYILEKSKHEYNMPAYFLPEVGHDFSQDRFLPLSNDDVVQFVDEETRYVPSQLVDNHRVYSKNYVLVAKCDWTSDVSR